MKYYVVVDVGCIECGESTTVLGVYTDQAEAEKAFEDFPQTISDKGSTRLNSDGYFAGGQHSIELHEIPVPKRGKQ